jgi:light-regulated signal transduction histidine kinase (bacteriophytochrome)
VQLQEANKELESFAYSVSHDLRAPLRTLNGFSKILLRQPDESLSDQTVHYLELINKSALRMDQLVSGLLEYSRTGRAAMHPDWVAPDGIVQELMEELGMQYPTATILAEALPRCWADRQLLRQVLQNLLGNALKFSSKRSDAVIQVGAKRNGEEVIYFVRDNGEGFDPTYSDRLFRVFQRLHTEEDYEGTGIGLALVGSIITRHGGRVWAESKPNEGATFFFTLPGGEHKG